MGLTSQYERMTAHSPYYSVQHELYDETRTNLRYLYDPESCFLYNCYFVEFFLVPSTALHNPIETFCVCSFSLHLTWTQHPTQLKTDIFLFLYDQKFVQLILFNNFFLVPMKALPNTLDTLLCFFLFAMHSTSRPNALYPISWQVGDLHGCSRSASQQTVFATKNIEPSGSTYCPWQQHSWSRTFSIFLMGTWVIFFFKTGTWIQHSVP